MVAYGLDSLVEYFTPSDDGKTFWFIYVVDDDKDEWIYRGQDNTVGRPISFTSKENAEKAAKKWKKYCIDYCKEKETTEGSYYRIVAEKEIKICKLTVKTTVKIEEE